MIFDDSVQLIRRTLVKPDYSDTPMIDGYEDADRVYKHFRDNVSTLSECVAALSNYEYGGLAFRQFAAVSNAMATTSKITVLERTDMYTAISSVGSNLVSGNPPSALTATAASFAIAYRRIAESKQHMNVSLGTQQQTIKDLKQRAKHVDKARQRVANLRSDLAQAQHSKPPKPPEEIAKLEQEFAKASKVALDGITDFIGDNGVGGILHKVADIHREFAQEEAEALKSIG